ncbi:hypothetical protein AB0D38_42340, partial [Streptomyces sp. NPDC048279]
MKASAFVYPWDVNGDPGAPERIAALGVRQVTLASAYHSTRALTRLNGVAGRIQDFAADVARLKDVENFQAD